MLLGDFGADVIKVEGADPDRRDEPGAAVWDRNKRSVTVDPHDRTDREWLRESVCAADVCILGAGRSLEDWGDDAVAAAASNTGLIVVRLPAWLDGTTPWDGSESNGLLSAYGGQAARQSSVAGGPIESMSPFLLYIQGLWAAACAVASLVERGISGRGQTVTVTGVQAVLVATSAVLCTDPALPDVETTVGPAGKHPTYRHFRCADGTWLSVGALGEKFATLLLETLGLRSEILEDPRIDGVTIRMLLRENNGWCTKAIADAIAARNRADLLADIAALGIPCGPVQSRDEWFDHPQIEAIGMRVRVADPVRGPVEMPGVPLQLTRTPGGVTRHAPARGEHDGVAPWSSRPATDVSELRYVEGPLHGLRVLNMGTFVATPYAGVLLAELGADVIKVEQLDGDPFRASAFAFNRGMRSLAIDLTTRAGRDTLHRIVAVSDVVLDGMRPGVMARLGADYESLAAVNPRIVTMSLSAYGEGGPLSGRPGVDMVVQGESGMMSSWGGDGTPVANTIAINDVATATMSVLACVLALFERQVSGRGQRTWDSLAATSTFLQMDQMVRYAGRPRPHVGQTDLRGLSASQSYYEASDGWLYLDAGRDRAEQVVNVLREAGLMQSGEPLHDDQSPGELATWVADRNLVTAIADLRAAGFRAAKARSVTEVLRDPELLDHEAFHIVTDADGRGLLVTGRHAGFSRTQRRGPMRAPGVGQHSRAVLAQAGLDEQEIDDLLARDVVRQGTEMAQVLPLPYR